jgi:RNA polymerase sigma factor (sigma-70 family)
MAPVTATTHTTTPAARSYDEYCATSVRIAARGLIGRYGIREQDCDDVQQDLVVNLLPRLAAFDPAKGTWTTHVKNAVAKAMATYIRHRCAQRRVPQKSVETAVDQHKDASVDQATDDMLDPRSQIAEANMDLRIDLAAAMEHLNDRQRRICQALRMGMTMTEVSTHLGIERWQIYRSITQIRSVFNRFGLDPATI